jgi:RNA polymerase sigma-32 factor
LPEEPVDIELEGSVIEAEGPPPELAAELGLVEREGAGGEVAAYDPLVHYLAEVRRAPHLTREEEHRLAVLYREHEDREAGARLILASLRVVVIIAMEYRRTGMPILDLIQEGNLGLLQSLKKFDPHRGIRLNTYASWWIRAYVLRYILANWRLVRIGTTQAQRKLFYNLRKEQRRLESQGFEAGPKLLAERLDVREKDVIEMDARLGAWEVPIDQPVRADSDTSLGDLLPAPGDGADETLAKRQFADLFRRKLAEFAGALSERDRAILMERIVADPPRTLQEIGTRFKISRERARQLEARILKNLRAFLRESIPDLDAMGILPLPGDKKRGGRRPPSNQPGKSS